jgi:hypothetical protein
MDKEVSFLDIGEINEANKERLLKMRQTLIASLVRNKDHVWLYSVSLVIFSEFERLTQHILATEIIKN